ncbi:structural protein c105 [Metallosphaera turreted icosahedral virus]|uniref:virion structural protein n=1 Tax=Metallosphaera turreted icosahedral virus TaxID=2023155 RepID=UPI000B8D398A|nr:virion structural protein [Metallosphaera turreted icosahedral virus]ASO67390.1 structural protein c105 [Metallosphaera turreted icosahedral virus]ASO67411.1 structural protein c105 [Metallosphaera turreted icosahedral virus]
MAIVHEEVTFHTEVDDESVEAIRRIIRDQCGENPKPECWGPLVWSMFDSVARAIPCPKCRGEALEFLTFLHDLINIQKGSAIYNTPQFLRKKKEEILSLLRTRGI